MSLSTIIANLRTTLATIDGLERVYADPPESINEFPSAVVWAGRGELTVASDDLAIDTHTVLVQIYQNRQILPSAIDASKVWPELVRSAVAADYLLGGSITHLNWPLRYTCGPLRYGDNTYFGVSFELSVTVKGSYE